MSRSTNYCGRGAWCAIAPRSRRWNRRWRDEAARADRRPPTDGSGPAGVRWNGERQAERSRSAPPLGPPTDGSGLAGPATMTRAAREILIRPLMTEKSMRQKEEQNTVAFKVRPDANKVEIRVAVEAVFNVKVASVRPASFAGKLKRLGRFAVRRGNWDKAIVKLQPGHKIELVEGA